MVTKKTETDEAAQKAVPSKAETGKSGGRGAAKASARGEAGAPVSMVKGKIDKAREFYEQARVELKKVTWPTRKETVNTGVAVLLLVVVMSLFLGLVDLGLARLVELILA
ncbi:preprotein translocase subunit SecE [Desulfolutivibrio sulfoxidireducens]|uniref:preprotein translocase subunit SecE n=1 Tax=Desulfolutivibrio sulfoxidireducens TaxID=2773299 RepID=UPI00159EB676|nr:preprotein translocase subunit SecE [Desulfolutivibrio sulfoxidireducens]QLA16519.1 preprotein translocase subunit SecE [Desulfolutivibrio sulfoxidireducens]QLA19603.1 preprotein translocase subunit SecE [Desulfolutivibrio sulfoxidireducens]